MADKTKKMTIKSLTKEFEIMKKVMLEEVSNLKETVKELQKEVQELKGNNPENASSWAIKCRNCESTFETIKNLKKHSSVNHPSEVKCVSCDKTFLNNLELELHIKAAHKDLKGYNCDNCDKKFVFKWRLLKHAQIHASRTDVKRCHYFNNNSGLFISQIGVTVVLLYS